MEIQKHTPALQDEAVMSSREIAELCEKRHDNVVRDIEKMLDTLEIGLLTFEGTYQTAQGKGAKEYLLPKDLTLTLVSGYRVDLRYKIVKRVEALEAANMAPVLPDFTNPAVAARAWANEVEEKQAALLMLEDAREDQEALERIAKADGSLCVTDAAKALQIRPKELFSYLRENGWIYKRAGAAHNCAYQAKQVQGLLEHKVTTVLRADGSEKITEQVRITPKGLEKLAKLLPPPAQAA